MKIDNSANITKLALQTEIIKKSQDLAVNQISYLLEKNLGTDAEKKAAQFLGKGINLNIKT